MRNELIKILQGYFDNQDRIEACVSDLLLFVSGQPLPQPPRPEAFVRPAPKQAALPQAPAYRVTQFSYWDTLMEMVNGWTHKECPKFSKDRIKQGQPVSWNSDTKTLLVAIPEAEWANARWARTLSNMLQGLCQGSKIVFQEAQQ